MCLIAFAHRAHPRYPLVLVANRDEFYDRPTEVAGWWREPAGILAGRDLQAGGTWLGVTRRGRWAGVTNYREGRPPPADRSRGELVLDFLDDNNADPGHYAAAVASRGERYNGFNLLAGDGDSLAYCTNRGREPRLLDPGVYTLSNHLLDTPWPKAEQARFRLRGVLRREDFSPGDLFEVLADRTPVEDEALLPASGIDRDLERALSPAFIVGDEYGTRYTTVLLMDSRGGITFVEQNYLRGEPEGPQRPFYFERDGLD